MITLNQNDTDEPIRATLNENGAAVNLTGYDVFFIFSLGPSRTVFRRACVVEDAAAGKVRYDWQDDDLASPGQYQGAFQAVAQATGRKKTFPTKDRIPMEVVAVLGN